MWGPEQITLPVSSVDAAGGEGGKRWYLDVNKMQNGNAKASLPQSTVQVLFPMGIKWD